MKCPRVKNPYPPVTSRRLLRLGRVADAVSRGIFRHRSGQVGTPGIAAAHEPEDRAGSNSEEESDKEASMALSVFRVYPAAKTGGAIPTLLRMGLLAILVTCGGILAAAQGVSGRIVGTLTDSSGAVIPNANVT